MKLNNILEEIDKIVANIMTNKYVGHDYFHVDRVRKNALKIASHYDNIDLFIVEAAALLHDIADYKFYDGDEDIGREVARNILLELGVDFETTDKIAYIVANVSFKGLGVKVPVLSIEGQIVQDADRLDAIGAIGVARTFAYGGSKGHPLYDPNVKPVCHTSMAAYKTSTAPVINHFYEKLLHLKEKMNTEIAKDLAKDRHAFIEDFLKQFYKEWI